jgi:hypothetical protein
MKIIKNITSLLFLVIFIPTTYAQKQCEEITQMVVDRLAVLLKDNDAQTIVQNLNTIEASCGESEFTLRTRIIYQIINKESTMQLRSKYIKNKFDKKLIARWDESYHSNNKEIYEKDKRKYDYVPLKHMVDSLLKLKATALLNSTSYENLLKEEEALLYLFKDDIETYENLTITESNPKKSAPTEEFQHVDKHTFGIHTGLFMPLGTNAYFGKTFTGGVSIMSSFVNDFVFDVHYKFRVHSKAPAFDFMYKNEIREVASNSSHVLAVGIGYKLLDKNRFIILPKLNLGYGIIWTGLSETVYGEDDEGNETETRLPTNVQTLHSTLGVSIMRHLSNKTYIGIEGNVHLVPYKWDNRLQSTIPSKYASLEFFVRF